MSFLRELSRKFQHITTKEKVNSLHKWIITVYKNDILHMVKIIMIQNQQSELV